MSVFSNHLQQFCRVGCGSCPYVGRCECTQRPLRSGEIMKSVRVVFALVGLLSLPLVAAEAQGQSAANKCKNTPQAGQNGNSQHGAAAVAAAQANKCPAPVPPPAPPAPVPPPPPPPPPSSPPTGSNSAKGLVFEDVDGNGIWDKFGGEMGLAGWTVQLLWNGQVINSATTDANGVYQFGSLG